MRYSSGLCGYEIYLCLYNGKQLCVPWGERAKGRDVLFKSLQRLEKDTNSCQYAQKTHLESFKKHRWPGFTKGRENLGSQ